MNKSEMFILRSATPADDAFIYSTWLKNLFFRKRHVSEDEYFKVFWIEEMEQDSFLINYRKVITLILAKPTTKVQLACLKEEPDVIVGYAVSDSLSPILHWVYVKPDWRNIGLARDLFPAELKFITHLTRQGISIKRKYNLIYDPFLI